MCSLMFQIPRSESFPVNRSDVGDLMSLLRVAHSDARSPPPDLAVRCCARYNAIGAVRCDCIGTSTTTKTTRFYRVVCCVVQLDVYWIYVVKSGCLCDCVTRHNGQSRLLRIAHCAVGVVYRIIFPIVMPFLLIRMRQCRPGGHPTFAVVSAGRWQSRLRLRLSLWWIWIWIWVYRRGSIPISRLHVRSWVCEHDNAID